MKFNYSYLLVIFLATTAIQAQNCVRNPYLGGPQNAFIKATESVNDMLQVSNMNTEAFYLRSFSDVAVDGSAFTDYFFRIEDDSSGSTIDKLLLVRVSTYQNYTFVDDYLMIPMADSINGTDLEDILDEWHDDYDTAFYNEIIADATKKNCNLMKESFTYFYELFGQRFKQDLNN